MDHWHEQAGTVLSRRFAMVPPEWKAAKLSARLLPQRRTRAKAKIVFGEAQLAEVRDHQVRSRS
jgi:hypothetical protein